ncbi:MAG: enoyl-CoA hydratase/isomerase family protein [Betaproteobacteria bacterium]|nr:MAG: enoyl-CoA hydratase/isomerase family protein [Betaproteobacteria bacterium]
MYKEILYEVNDPVATITMNRPDRLNAFTSLMLAEIKHALAQAEKDERVVGVILTGAGRGFCAGMDMGALDKASAGDREEVEDLTYLDANPGNPDMGDQFPAMYSHLGGLRKPVIAAVNGPAAGMGMAYALLCDMRFVDKCAKFSTAFSQRGLVAEHAMSWILPRLIGPSRALDILWSARKFDGTEAMQLGIADRLCEVGASVNDARAYITELAKVACPTSLMVIKQQVYKHLDRDFAAAMDETVRLMDDSLERSDFREGVRSYIERRSPQFARISFD